jgi:hypothetical protein
MHAQSADETPVTSRALATLILLILVQFVAVQSINVFPRLTKIDFYQYWGVGAARRLSVEPLGSPYTNHESYTAVLRDYAARPDQPRLQPGGRPLSPKGFTATPFTYVLFAALPADYTRAMTLFHVLQVLLFLAAVAVLGAVYRYEMFPLLCLALLLVLGSGPLSSDLRLGNLGCVQLASLTGILYVADRLQRARRATPLGPLVLTLLVLVGLVKPNVAPVVIIMAVHLWLVHGSRSFAIAAVPAAVSAAVAVIVPCVYFHSWTIWQEWYVRVFGVLGRHSLGLARPAAIDGVVRPVGGGNYSTAKMLARALHLETWMITLVLAAICGLSLIAVVAAVTPRASPWALVRRTLERVAGDAQLSMALGITMTIALPPLVWYHYYVIALIPGLWLLNASSGSTYLPLCGLASLFLGSGLLNVLFLPLGWTGVAGVAAALSWVPLWAGILLRVSSPGAQEAQAEMRDDSGTGRARPAGRPRRSRTASRA